MRMAVKRIALAGLLLLIASGCPGTGSPPPIFLGHVSNRGGAERQGEHAERGISLALKQLKDDDLAEWLQGRELQVRHTDTKGQLEGWESEAVRLSQVSRVVGLIGGVTPDEIARLDRGRVPVLAVGGTRPPGVSDMVFAVGMRPLQQGFVLAKHAAETISDIVILVDERRDEFLAAADAFGSYFSDTRRSLGKPTTTLHVRFGKDAKWAELAKMLVDRKSLGAVFFAGKSRDWVEIRRSQNLSIPLFFAGDDGDAMGIQGGDSRETVYFATAFAPDADASRGQEFRRKYREAFKEDPDLAAALGFESVSLFAAALKQAGPLFAPEKLRDALRDLKKFDGLCGVLDVTEDQYVRRPLYLVRQDVKSFEVLRRHEAADLP